MDTGLLIHAHRSAHDQQAGMIANAFWNSVAFEWPGETEFKAAGLEHVGNQARCFTRDVLDDADGALVPG